MYTNYNSVYANYLMHHGVKGQKWGVRKTKAWGLTANTRAARQHDLNIKNDWIRAKNKAKAGVISKKSNEYRNAKLNRADNLLTRANSYMLGYSKGAQGVYYRSRQAGKSRVMSSLAAIGHQSLKNMAIAGIGAAGYMGANYLQSRMRR